jgi:hypothetical protein
MRFKRLRKRCGEERRLKRVKKQQGKDNSGTSTERRLVDSNSETIRFLSTKKEKRRFQELSLGFSIVVKLKIAWKTTSGKSVTRI